MDQGGFHRERPVLPDYKSEYPEHQFDLIPQIPQKNNTLIESNQIYVSRFNFSGNTVFSMAELSELAKPFTNRALSFEELENLRLRITHHYIDNGYINSGAIIPDQAVINGTIEFQIIEGRLTDIQIAGNKKLCDFYIRNRLLLGMDGPLNVQKLQERVRLLNENPLIERINAELGPGPSRGKAVLAARIIEASPFTAGIEVHNEQSPRVGSEGGTLYASDRNLLGVGDSLGFRAALTRGLRDFQVYYEAPLNARDTTLRVRYERSSSEVVENPFDMLNIESESSTLGFDIRHPVYHGTSGEIALGFRCELRESETFLLGHPFSFTSGMENGKSRLTALRFFKEWFFRKPAEVVAFRSVFSLGIEAFGASVHTEEPDARFFSWLGQFQWARRIFSGQMLLRTDAQFCNESVPPIEKFCVGGAHSVRGYRTNQLVRDNAVVVSLELRYPFFQLPLPGLSRGSEEGNVHLAVFTDWGWAENINDSNFGPKTIGSAGPGLRWDPGRNLHAEVYWGIAFRHTNPSEYTLQDSGIHFLINWRML